MTTGQDCFSPKPNSDDELERELAFMADEFLWSVCSQALLNLQDLTRLVVEVGLRDQAGADDFLAEMEDYWLNVPKAFEFLHKRQDPEGWLASWLSRHPEFVQDYLNGQWPDWLVDSGERF